VTALAAERAAAFTAADHAAAQLRLATAIIRDGMPTHAEQEARMTAFVECLGGAS